MAYELYFNKTAKESANSMREPRFLTLILM